MLTQPLARAAEPPRMVHVMAKLPLHRYTFAEYLELEAESPTKHEFLDGEILAIACGTPAHAALAMAVGYQLSRQLEGKRCRVFSSDLRIRVASTGLTTYPDVSVICGPVELDADSPTTATNPRLLVEVTSPSSEDYDRGTKLEHYQQIPSVDAVVIVSHRESIIDVWTRSDGGWAHARGVHGQRARIAPLEIVLDVAALYDAVEEPSA